MIAHYPSANPTHRYPIIGVIQEAVTALIRGIRGNLIKLRLQPPAHLIAKNGRVKPIKPTSPVRSKCRKRVNDIGFVPDLIPEHEPFLTFDQRELPYHHGLLFSAPATQNHRLRAPAARAVALKSSRYSRIV